MRAAKRPKRKQKRSLNKKPAFLAAFKVCGSLTEAAAAVGIDRGEHYAWLLKDRKYAKAFEDAKPEMVQTLLDSAVTRALRGVFVPNVYQGRFCYPQENFEIEPGIPAVMNEKGEVLRAAIPARMGMRDVPGAAPLGTYVRSEMLHAALLRAHIAAFRAGTLEVTGKDGGPVEVGIVATLNAARNRLAAKRAKTS
jgi:hypothetical protein